MPVTAVEKDLDQLTLTVVADFAAPLDRVWNAYVDPRQIERFWGPPTHPATFYRHDASVGGRSFYVMNGPEGEHYPGYWEWTAVDAPHSFEVRDGFALADGSPDTSLPVSEVSFEFTETDAGTRLVTVTRFASVEDLQTVLDLGIEEGTREAMGQIDAVLADLASFSASLPAEAQILSDTQVRVARVIRGSVEQVWRAHHERELMQRWLLGPDGWTMPVCEIARAVGDTYRYEWEKPGEPESRFGFTGRLVESAAPSREVTTESMIGMPGETLNELTLTPVDGGTLLSLVITYADAEMRDMVLATGMTGGMETSYARLESVLAGVSA